MKENEVLARFMGHEIKEGWVTLYPGGEMNVCNLKYDKDWNDLMPVWYKFRDLKFEDAGSHLNYKIQIVNAIVNKGPSPEEACKRLSEAIEWYNANKQL